MKTKENKATDTHIHIVALFPTMEQFYKTLWLITLKEQSLQIGYVMLSFFQTRKVLIFYFYFRHETFRAGMSGQGSAIYI